jgi:hypothetical protein
MLQYWSHFKYIMIHKYRVFVECTKEGIVWRGLIHDLSKFRLSEFIAYSNYFFYKDGLRRNISKDPPSVSAQEGFRLAWCYHQNRNDHHWNFWVIEPHNAMIDNKDEDCAVLPPMGAMKEMVCDMIGASAAQGNKDPYKGAWEYYLKHKPRIIVHPVVDMYIESKLHPDKLVNV